MGRLWAGVGGVGGWHTAVRCLGCACLIAPWDSLPSGAPYLRLAEDASGWAVHTASKRERDVAVVVGRHVVVEEMIPIIVHLWGRGEAGVGLAQVGYRCSWRGGWSRCVW